MTAFLDFPAESFEAGIDFWSGVTGWAVSEPRGTAAEFATLVPPSGDPTLKVQRIGSGPPRVHLDVHGPEESLDLRSPAGFVYCLVDHPARSLPPVSDWGTHASAVDQVCLDIPPAVYDEECAFWASLTGWPWADTGDSEFRRLQPPAGQPFRLLLQRQEVGGPAVTAHFDLATTSRSRETRRHESLGATVREVFDEWTVLEDPTGLVYCITDRPPR